MVAESPAKFKPKLPQSTPGTGVGYLPMAMPRQREPYLYPFKLPLVVVTLASLTMVMLSPWPRYHHLLWFLVAVCGCSLCSVICQAIRMVSLVAKYRQLYCCGNSGTASAGSVAAGSNGAVGSPASINGPTKDVVAGAKMLLVDTPSRPGHKKSLRAKGHRANVSIDAADCCDQSAESVALVIDCEHWSESTSSSGTDWSAGPPRWNHVFVIPNYKEVRQGSTTVQCLRK
jgi:hypothetical protein